MVCYLPTPPKFTLFIVQFIRGAASAIASGKTDGGEVPPPLLSDTEVARTDVQSLSQWNGFLFSCRRAAVE